MCVFFPGMFTYMFTYLFFSIIATSSQGCRVGLLVKPMAFEAWISMGAVFFPQKNVVFQRLQEMMVNTLHLKGVKISPGKPI